MSEKELISIQHEEYFLALEGALEMLVDRCNDDALLCADDAVIYAESVLERLRKSRLAAISKATGDQS